MKASRILPVIGGLMVIALVRVMAGHGQTTTNPSSIVDDSPREISISYTESAASAIFTARVREGSLFSVQVDGNQDEKWGSWAFDDRSTLRPTDDVSFAVGRQRTVCAQYIYSADRENPDLVYATSTCGLFPSAATIETTTSSNRVGFVSIAYEIPKVELFRKRTNARVLISVLDSTGTHGYYTLKNPLVLAR